MTNLKRNEIVTAFEALYPGHTADAYYEHGRWWVVALADDSEADSVESDPTSRP